MWYIKLSGCIGVIMFLLHNKPLKFKRVLFFFGVVVKIFNEKRIDVKNNLLVPSVHQTHQVFGRITYKLLDKSKHFLLQCSNEQTTKELSLYMSLKYTIIRYMLRSCDNPLTTEEDYFDTLRLLGFQQLPLTHDAFYKSKSFNDLCSIAGIEWWFNEQFGISTVAEISHEVLGTYFIFDYTRLGAFKYRRGFEKLGGMVKLKLEDGKLKFHSINDTKHPTAYEIRLLLTSSVTYMTVITHALYQHMLAGNNVNYILESCQPTSFIRRLLSPITVNAYESNEVAAVTLLGKSGVNMMFNMSYSDFYKNLNLMKNQFDFRQEFDFRKTLDGMDASDYHDMPLQLDMVKWWTAITTHVDAFVDQALSYDTAIRDMDEFLQKMNRQYYKLSVPSQDVVEATKEICAMCLFLPVQHELLSNPSMMNIVGNPFIFPSTYLTKNKPSRLVDSVRTAIVASATSLTSFKFTDDNTSIAINNNERTLLTKFASTIKSLDIDPSSIVHPSNIESSIRW